MSSESSMERWKKDIISSDVSKNKFKLCARVINNLKYAFCVRRHVANAWMNNATVTIIEEREIYLEKKQRKTH